VRCEAYAQTEDIVDSFGSHEEMLSSAIIDPVYVVPPNHLHAKWTIRALESGLHVLCEKPFALTLEDVDAMVRAAESVGCVLAEAFMYRHHPQTKLIGEWVQSGRLGHISVVRGAFNFIVGSPDNIRLVPEWGGGSLWDVGVYPLSFAQYVYGGPPLSVSGEQWIGDSGVDETFVGQLRYEGDRLAQITSSLRTPFYTCAEIIGSEGRLLLSRPFVDVDEGQMTFYPAQGEPQAIAVPEKELYLGQVEDMHAAILDGAPNYLSLAETRNHVRTVLALYESAHRQQRVTLR
jgi:predicted dehydrogenase